MGTNFFQVFLSGAISGNELIMHNIETLRYFNSISICIAGLDKLTNDFRSWNWNFGKTPKFTVTRAFEVTAHDGKVHRVNLRLDVQDGIVEEVRMSLPNELASIDFDQDANVITNLCGTRYNHEITDNIIAAIGSKVDTSNTIHTEDKSNVMVTQ